jgi:adenine-specific DNA-methyltransferase
VEALRRFDADLCYLDPPYNQHSYLGNYHVWESLVLWDKPEVYGIACKRMDCRERRSRFNFKTLFKTAMSELIHAVRAPVLVLSFSDEGYIQREELEAILRPRGEVAVLSHDYPRYVGSQIGIYNLDGKKVGKATHARNTEHLFVCAERLPDELRSAMTRS